MSRWPTPPCLPVTRRTNTHTHTHTHAHTHARTHTQVGDPTLSVMEIWGAEYQENNALLLHTKGETERQRETERPRDRETERHRVTERQRDRERL